MYLRVIIITNNFSEVWWWNKTMYSTDLFGLTLPSLPKLLGCTCKWVYCWVKKKSKQSWGSFIHLLCQIYSHKINYSAWFRPNTCQSQICVLKSKDNVKNADVLFCLFFWLLLSKTIHNSLEMVSGTWQVSVQDQDTRFLLQVWNNLKLGTHDKHELVREHGVSLFKISLEFFG